VDDWIPRVLEADGKVIEPKMPIPGIGWFAACVEPGGLLFGVVEADQAAQ
jgi:predicted enzyme related to lactoylglutathione lyase